MYKQSIVLLFIEDFSHCFIGEKEMFSSASFKIRVIEYKEIQRIVVV